MLVLSRKAGEAIVIDGHIHVHILGVRKDGAVRVGIEAPRGIAVHREEIQQRIDAKEKAS